MNNLNACLLCAIISLVFAMSCASGKTDNSPSRVSREISVCELARGATSVVKGSVKSFEGSSTSMTTTDGRALQVIVTNAIVRVDEGLLGERPGDVPVMVVGKIGSDGSSEVGKLRDSLGFAESGFIFITQLEGKSLLGRAGFLKSDGTTFVNEWVAPGMTEKELRAEILRARTTGTVCSTGPLPDHPAPASGDAGTTSGDAGS